MTNSKKQRGGRMSEFIGIQPLEARLLMSADGPFVIDQGQPADRISSDEIIVAFEGSVAEAHRRGGRAAALAMADALVGPTGLHGAKVLFDLPDRGHNGRMVTRWQLPAGNEAQTMVDLLRGLPGIAYAEVNGSVWAQVSPGDPSFTNPVDWPFGVQEHLIDDIAAESAWDITQGESVIVAVIDSGVDLDHPDLNDNLLIDGSGNVVGGNFVGASFGGNAAAQGKGNGKGNGNGGGGGPNNSPNDDYGHGTHVAGIIAAELDNLADNLLNTAAADASWAGGVVGVAPQATIMPVKVLDETGRGTFTAVAEGIIFAADNGADIINMSLGGVFSQAVQDAIDYAYNTHDVLVISAAGNGDTNELHYPSADPFSLAVAAVDTDDVRASFSNYGTWVDVAAPGVSILSTLIDGDNDPGTNGGYGRASGTSMASPVAAGVAALIQALHPEWSAADVAAQVLATADNIDAANAGYEGMLGSGRVNATAALGTQAAPVVVGGGALGAVYALEFNLVPRFSHVMDGATVLDLNNYELTFAGADGLFDTADDQAMTLQSDATAYAPFPGQGIALNTIETLAEGDYRFTVHDTVTASDGTAIDGDRDGAAGGDFVREFSYEPPAWDTELVFDGGGYSHDIEVGPNDEVTIAYGYNGELHLALRNGGSWDFVTVPDSSTSYFDLEFDAAGDIALGFHDSRGNVMYGVYDGATWQMNQVSTKGASRIALSHDPTDGQPAMLYSVSVKRSVDLRYAKWNGASWDSDVLQDSINNNMRGLAFDATGVAHVTFAEGSTNVSQLFHMQRTAQGWTTPQAIRDGGSYLDMLADPITGQPVLVHTDFDIGADIGEVLRWNGSSWDVDILGESIYASDLALDADGNLIVGYSSQTDRVNIAWREADGWRHETVDTIRALDLKLAALSTGAPVMAYHDWDLNNLRFGQRDESPFAAGAGAQAATAPLIAESSLRAAMAVFAEGQNPADVPTLTAAPWLSEIEPIVASHN